MSDRQPSGAAAGWIMFAGFVMIIGGSFSALAGLALLINPDTWDNVTDTVIEQSATTWGWWKLIVGAVLILAGFGVFSGNVLARTVGVIAAVVSCISAFAWMNFYPVWAICIIAIDIAVIWALTAHGRDIQKMQEMDSGGM
jgi:hypothetical protein